MKVEALCPHCSVLWKSDDVQIKGKLSDKKKVELTIREMCCRFLDDLNDSKIKVRVIKSILADALEELENQPEPIDPRQTRLFNE